MIQRRRRAQRLFSIHHSSPSTQLQRNWKRNVSASNHHPTDPRADADGGRSTSTRRWLWLGAILLIVAALFISRPPQNAIEEALGGPAVGKPAPQIDLVRLESGAALSADEVSVGGKVQLLHFWGTWCPPCRMEYPHLAEVAGELSADPNFQFLPVSCESGPGETIAGLLEKTNQYFDSENIRSPALADPRGVTRRTAAERMGQPNLYFPTTILIGPDGNIAGVWEGYTPTAVDQIANVSRDLLSRL